MERKTQYQMKKTYKEFYIENFLVPVKNVAPPKNSYSTEERFLKIFSNLINLYKGIKILRKTNETAEYIFMALKPVFKLLNNGIRKNNLSSIDFSQMNEEQIKMKVKGLTASINLGLTALSEFYSGTDNDRMKNILSRVIDKFSTTFSLMEKL